MNMNTNMQKMQIFSGATLKYIAMLSMVIDHVNKALIWPVLHSQYGVLATISNVFDIVGRIAFPLFCFFIVEGFHKTKNRKKYLLTMLLFGFISEVPFDMATTSSFWNMNWNNVMFTLSFVLITIWCIDTLKDKLKERPRILWYLASFAIIAVVSFFSMNYGFDYEHSAIIMGYIFYLFYERPVLRALLGYLPLYTQPWTLLGLGLTLTYNGERGKQSKLFNYLFYPVHLLIIGIIRMYLGI